MVGAADTSDNWRYVSIIIGMKDDVKGIHRRLGKQRIHMRELPREEKTKIIKQFQIKGEVLVACLHVDRHMIVNEVESRLRGTRIAKRKYIECQFDYVFITEIKRIYRDFLNNHGNTFDNVVFEIDADLRKLFSQLGINNRDPDYVHDIADIIAYCNTRDRTVSQILERDLSTDLKVSLTKRLGI